MIQTERLLLRPLSEDDLMPLHAIFSDPDTMRYWDRPAWSDVDLTRRMLAMFMRDAPSDHLEYAVEHDSAFIGRVGMWKCHEIGFILDRKFWGRGFGSEAVTALVADAFARFPEAPHLTGEVDPRNAGSMGLLKKVGFRQAGLAEKNFDYGGIETCDTAHFTCPRPG